MTSTIIKGQKVDITKTNVGLNAIVVSLGWDVTNASCDLDGTAFLLDGTGKCRQDNNVVFYGNLQGGNNSVICTGQKNGVGDKEQVMVNLNIVPADIEKIAFTITIHEAVVKKQSFSQVSNVFLRISKQDNGQEIIFFPLTEKLTVETAIVMGELYRYNREWKFNAIGSGFQGGLAAMCQNYGIKTEESIEHDKSTVDSIKELGSPSLKPNMGYKITESKVKLSKVELKKKGEKISLEKTSNNKLGNILVNLNWSRTSEKNGVLFKQQGIDLDIGCLYELKSGVKGSVQALGNAFGFFDNPPYIKLDKDDRTGVAKDGENLLINGNKLVELKRILVYCFIYEGVANWAQANGVVTIKQKDSPDIVVRLDEYSKNTMCAIALIENVNNETLSIERIVRYFSNHQAMDIAFNWNMRWNVGRK